ncbi:MAG: CotH kinase family protein [Treponema sp.]|jgi:hypothetical protein|nr:CotH kinase family protein [Treponema sp.]
MKSKQYGFLLAIASVVLALTCNNPFDPLVDKPYPVKEGYGRVIVSVNDGRSARTALPSIDGLTYKYFFDDSDTETAPEADKSFLLTTGAHTVKVEAYVNNNTTPAASGSSSFTVTSSGTTVKVELNPVTGATGPGTFKYTITAPDDATVNCTLVKWPGYSPVTLTSDAALTGQLLDAGMYLFTVNVKKGNQYAGLTELVSIKPNLPTIYEPVFADSALHDPIEITSVDISVTPPAANATPATGADINGSGKFETGAVSWSPADSVFKEHTQYTASVTLTADWGYTFNLTDAVINSNPYIEKSGTTTETVTLSYGFAPIGGSNLLILQAYGNANNTGSPGGVSHSFVELYNNSDNAIPLDGMTLYFANGVRGDNVAADEAWKMLPLNGTIPAKGSFLILGAKHADLNGTRYIIDDDYYDIQNDSLSLNRRGFKAALIKGNAALTVQNPFDIDGGGAKVSGYIDMVGAANTLTGSNHDNIFGYETAPARNSASEAVRRGSLSDTDDNSVDFIAARYASDGFTDEELEVRRPRNATESKDGWDPFAAPALPPVSDNTLLILQIGAATDGNVSHSFVELYNNGDTAVNLSGYSLQYAAGFSTNSGNGAPGGNTTTDGSWNKIDLSGTIEPKHSFLILGSKGTSAAPALLIADDYGDINQAFVINNRCFKVALMSNTTLLTVQNPFNTDGNGTKAAGYVDMVGALNTSGTDYIQGYEENPIADLNKNTGQRRKTLDDHDNNAADFERAVYAGATAGDKELRRPKNHAYTDGRSGGGWDPMADPVEPPPPPETGAPSKLMILQANTFGNNNGGTAGLEKSAVELYNNTGAAIDLGAGNYYLHIGTAAAWTHQIKLTGTIPDKSSYLIVSSNPAEVNATPPALLPSADKTADFIITNNNFKIALMKNQSDSLTVDNPFIEAGLIADYVDMLGVGAAVNGFETAAFVNQSRPRVPRRISLTDTNNNSVDFSDVDYREGKLPTADLYKYWPRNSTMGAWDPITGQPQIDPQPKPPDPPAPELTLTDNSGTGDGKGKSGIYSSAFNLTLTATTGCDIYYSTDGSVPSAEKVGNSNYKVYKYNTPIQVVDRNNPMQDNVLATPENSKKFYMQDGDVRGQGDTPPKNYTGLTKNKVPKATVIRAVAVNTTSGKSSPVETRTYFIGNNLTNYSETVRVVSLVSDPDNLVSEDKGIMVQGPSNRKWDSNPPYNFRIKGSDWERPAYLEVFEGNANSKSLTFSTGVGIRVKGGYSRALGQKSLNVYFKSAYGINTLPAASYNLIPGAKKADGTPIDTYKGFMLRNGSNDAEYTKIYDVFLQDLLSDRSFATQISLPCVVYLNGEYWGPYNFQERYSDNHTGYKYGVDAGNTISWDCGEIDDGTEADMQYVDELYSYMYNNAYNKDLSTQADYAAFCNIVDIDNFIDYWAAEIYIYNEDWPHNNYRMWRTRSPEASPYGDTKWRYQMFDVEYSMGIYSQGNLLGQSKNIDAFAKILAEKNTQNNGINKVYDNNRLFIALLKNAEFCRKFINTMLDLNNVNFKDAGTKLDAYAAIYKPLMENTPGGYYDRWGPPWDGFSFTSRVTEAKSYLTGIKTKMVNEYLPTYFGDGKADTANIGSLGSLKNVTLSVQGASGTVKINTVSKSLSQGGTWAVGQYYTGVPVTVTAGEAPAGKKFDGWTVTSGSGTVTSVSGLTATVSFTGDVTITANYSNQ